MALERVPADIRKFGGVARMSDPKVMQVNNEQLTLSKLNTHYQLIKEIMDTVSIPVMAKVRVGHFAEAQILQSLGVDMIDESEGNSGSLGLTCHTYIIANECNF